jgi:hypothetical protein
VDAWTPLCAEINFTQSILHIFIVSIDVRAIRFSARSILPRSVMPSVPAFI